MVRLVLMDVSLLEIKEARGTACVQSQSETMRREQTQCNRDGVQVVRDAACEVSVVRGGWETKMPVPSELARKPPNGALVAGHHRHHLSLLFDLNFVSLLVTISILG